MPAKKPAPPGTLAYFGESGRQVFIRCKKCGHYKSVECYQLAQRFGWASQTRVIAERLRCTRCKSKQAEFTTDNLRLIPAVCPKCRRPMG
jgi:translation initiation factor 2 beta subunit (eIF-2beta)/eIF-5